MPTAPDASVATEHTQETVDIQSRDRASARTPAVLATTLPPSPQNHKNNRNDQGQSPSPRTNVNNNSSSVSPKQMTPVRRYPLRDRKPVVKMDLILIGCSPVTSQPYNLRSKLASHQSTTRHRHLNFRVPSPLTALRPQNKPLSFNACSYLTKPPPPPTPFLQSTSLSPLSADYPLKLQYRVAGYSQYRLKLARIKYKIGNAARGIT
ncbi:hypothetical protein J6590_086120 [Homalodisca vitripennis]|nr:hypothetical protein J6590_086120 [Homalodisca vitripennis]